MNGSEVFLYVAIVKYGGNFSCTSSCVSSLGPLCLGVHMPQVLSYNLVRIFVASAFHSCPLVQPSRTYLFAPVYSSNTSMLGFKVFTSSLNTAVVFFFAILYMPSSNSTSLPSHTGQYLPVPR